MQKLGFSLCDSSQLARLGGYCSVACVSAHLHGITLIPGGVHWDAIGANRNSPDRGNTDDMGHQAYPTRHMHYTGALPGAEVVNQTSVWKEA